MTNPLVSYIVSISGKPLQISHVTTRYVTFVTYYRLDDINLLSVTRMTKYNLSDLVGGVIGLIQNGGLGEKRTILT